MSTLTKLRRTTPGGRWWLKQARLLREWTITGRRVNDDGTEIQTVATSFGRTADEAIERFLTQQDRQRPNVFGAMPPKFERHELRAEVSL